MAFKASIDTLARIITIGTGILLIAAFFVIYLTTGFEFWYLLLLLIATFGIAYLYRPLDYSVEKNTLSIKRPINTILIDLHDIKKVTALTDTDLGMAIRLFASGGFCGYYGFFYSFKLGKMWWYVTQRKNYVLIQTTNGAQYLLSPNEPQDLINALHKF